MAKVTRSDTAYSIYIASQPLNGAMTVWALRDFVRALDAEGIPDNANVQDHHNHDTKHFNGLSVRHTVVTEAAEPDRP